jgi:hypothetical protein
VLLSNISRVVKNISHSRIYRVKYKSINNKLVLNLDLLVLEYRGDTVYKRIRVLKLDHSRLIKYTRGASLRG